MCHAQYCLNSYESITNLRVKNHAQENRSVIILSIEALLNSKIVKTFPTITFNYNGNLIRYNRV